MIKLPQCPARIENAIAPAALGEKPRHRCTLPMVQPHGTEVGVDDAWCMHCASQFIHFPGPKPGRELANDPRLRTNGQYPTPQHLGLGCRHIGKEIDTVECASCQGRVRVKVFKCAVFDKCTLGKNLNHEGIKGVCAGCPSYAPKEKPKPGKPVAERLIRLQIPDTDFKREGYFNCSICEYDGRLLLATRSGWTNSILAIWDLDWETFAVTGGPYLFDQKHSLTQSGREDPRLWKYGGNLHISFSGVQEIVERGKDGLVGRKELIVNPMVLRLAPDSQGFRTEKIWSPEIPDRPQGRWEKNFAYFESGGKLYSVYETSPTHSILRHEGEKTAFVAKLPWPKPIEGWAHFRGGAPPVRVGNEFWSFFHLVQDRPGQNPDKVWALGLYTFSATFPFEPRRFVPYPLLEPDYAEAGNRGISVVFPCGALLRDGKWIISQGYHDTLCELSIFDHEALEAALIPVTMPVQIVQPREDLPPMYCITCEQTPERGASAKAQFGAMNLPVQMFQGIHGATWGIETTIWHKPGEARIPPGHVGNILSHWNLWQHLLLIGVDEALIMEDDVILPDNFPASFKQAMAHVPADWQFVFVGSHPSENEAAKITRYVAPGVVEMRDPYCTHCYLVKKSALPILLSTNQRAWCNIDLQIAKYSLPSLKTYVLWPPLANQHTLIGSWPGMSN